PVGAVGGCRRMPGLPEEDRRAGGGDCRRGKGEKGLRPTHDPAPFARPSTRVARSARVSGLGRLPPSAGRYGTTLPPPSSWTESRLRPAQPFASFTSHEPLTHDQNSGCDLKPSDA